MICRTIVYNCTISHIPIIWVLCFRDSINCQTIPPICPSCCFRGQIGGRVHISILVCCLYYLPSTILIELILVKYFSEKSLMRIHVCHLNRIDKMSLIIFRISYLSIEFTIVVFLTPLHTEKYQCSVKSVLYYNYSIKTDHSILYIVLIINTYQKFIENRALSILNHHKISGVGKSWNFDDIGKIITNTSYHQKFRKLLPSFPKNHTCFFCCIVYHILFI